ncbi:unnamed protein product, partial [Symbiodinium sp. CCMP2456]
MASSSKDNRPTSLWQMNKTQLFAEASKLNIVTHPSWIMGEVRQLIADKTRPDHNPQRDGERDPRSVDCRMRQAGGQLLLIIRDSTTYGRANCVVTFGRHKGKLFSEKEVEAQGWDACSPDLVSLSMYAAEVFEKDLPFDPEASPSVPIPEDNASVTSCWKSQWSELTDVAKELNGVRAPWGNQQPISPKATPKKQTEDDGKEATQQDVPPEVKQDVEDLMARLAALK